MNDANESSAEFAAALLNEHYALSGRLDALPGYRDRNFLLTTGSGDRFVVKFTQGGESRRDLALQNRAMSHAAAAGLPVPVAVANAAGEDVTHVALDDTACLFRVLTFLPGAFYADAPAESHTPALWSDLGALLGKLDATLADFPPPASGASSQWDLAHGYVVCRNALHVLDDAPRRLVGGLLEHYRGHVMPHLGELPRSVIHNDANDHNLLVDDAGAPSRIAGLIDFGDLMFTHTVNEIAIASAYALMGQPDPVATLTQLVAAYHGERSLVAAEVSAIDALVRLRLCTSVCNAAIASAQHPGNAYLQVSAEPALELLARLRGESPYAVECELRRACAMPTDPGRCRRAAPRAQGHAAGPVSGSVQGDG
ncbi:MAG: phosphotransferase [Proteobacteria bacterium]|nr:phosphotransferase [Pseudomonadota bacterium]